MAWNTGWQAWVVSGAAGAAAVVLGVLLAGWLTFDIDEVPIFQTVAAGLVVAAAAAAMPRWLGTAAGGVVGYVVAWLLLASGTVDFLADDTGALHAFSFFGPEIGDAFLFIYAITGEILGLAAGGLVRLALRARQGRPAPAAAAPRGPATASLRLADARLARPASGSPPSVGVGGRPPAGRP